VGERIPNEVITAAERVLRHLQDGREPYAPSVMPMARALVELAREPAFILPAAEAMLRESGACALDGLASRGDVGLRWYPEETTTSDTTASVCYAWARTLLDAYTKLLAARKPAGEEGG
jgi:hypothetical protein